MFWRVYKTTFDAAHYIKGHPKCGETHGHTYHVVISIGYETVDFVDFHEIKTNVDKVLSRYDHHNMGNRTCESLASLILRELIEAFPTNALTVELMETEKFGVKMDWTPKKKPIEY